MTKGPKNWYAVRFWVKLNGGVCLQNPKKIWLPYCKLGQPFLKQTPTWNLAQIITVYQVMGPKVNFTPNCKMLEGGLAYLLKWPQVAVLGFLQCGKTLTWGPQTCLTVIF